MADEVREEDFTSLAEKLENLDLSPAEKILLNAIIENASDESEVMAFDSAEWLLNANFTARRVQVSSQWSLGPYRPHG